jgi:hypothetical protein
MYLSLTFQRTVFSPQRVMPSSFFLLLRFFLRIDGVLIRMNDTRLYHEVPCSCDE